MTGPVLGCFKDYLSGRTQRVIVEGTASTQSSVTSGVLQGNILGPFSLTIFQRLCKMELKQSCMPIIVNYTMQLSLLMTANVHNNH